METVPVIEQSGRSTSAIGLYSVEPSVQSSGEIRSILGATRKQRGVRDVTSVALPLQLFCYPRLRKVLAL